MEKRPFVSPLFAIAFLVGLAAVFLDAAFQASKASFLSRLGAWDTAGTVIGGFALLLLPVAMALGALKLLLAAFGNSPRMRNAVRSSVLFVLSLAFSAVVFLHLDTWTYTTFGFGVVDLPRPVNIALLFLVGAAALALYRKKGEAVYGYMSGVSGRIMAVYLLAFLFLLLCVSYRIGAWSRVSGAHSSGEKRAYPNIVIFTIDRVDAERVGAYGYGRDTTPNADQLAKTGFLFTKAFSNAGNSRGSVISTLTGKSPFTTRVFYPPDILLGMDSFEHLPGILADLGYYCADYGDTYYVSPEKSNMQGAFHREHHEDKDLRLTSLKRALNLEVYFVAEMLDRARERAAYMAGLSKELLYYRAMAGEITTPRVYNDGSKAADAVRVIRRNDSPVFLHIHVMATHDPYYEDIVKRYSAGKKQTEPYEPDFYDDAILTADGLLGRFRDALILSGEYENTLLIVTSDHPWKYGSIKPIPLIVHLPRQKAGMVVDTPVQLLDLAPSILGYLGIKPPGWMEGTPIFPEADEEALKERPIYMMNTGEDFNEEKMAWVKKTFGPPFYGVETAAMAKGGFVYNMNLESGVDEMYDISGRGVRPLGKGDEAARGRYREGLLRYLKQKGLDISAIRNPHIKG